MHTFGCLNYIATLLKPQKTQHELQSPYHNHGRPFMVSRYHRKFLKPSSKRLKAWTVNPRAAGEVKIILLNAVPLCKVYKSAIGYFLRNKLLNMTSW